MVRRAVMSGGRPVETLIPTGHIHVVGGMTTRAYVDIPPIVRAAELLRTVHELVAVGYGADDPLTMAALHLIDCATDAVTLLPDGDLPSAHEALGCARAAVGAATYAVRQIHDRIAVEASARRHGATTSVT